MRLHVTSLLVAVACSTPSKKTNDARLTDVGAPDSGSLDTGVDGGPRVEPDAAVTALPDSVMSAIEEASHERMLLDLAAVAIVRPPDSEGWQSVQDLCLARFAELGFETELVTYRTGVNVIGTRAGTGSDEQVLLSAHYDHIEDCPGADDNASGVVELFEAARLLGALQFEKTLVVACWDEEESGLIGSQAFATAAEKRDAPIVLSLVYETAGYASSEPNSQTVPEGFSLLFGPQYAELEANEFRGDFLAVIADDEAMPGVAGLVQAGAIVGLPITVMQLPRSAYLNPALSDLLRSDHAAFWLHGFAAMMVTDTANFRNTHYHCGAGPDTADRLDPVFMRKIVQATTASAALVLGPTRLP